MDNKNLAPICLFVYKRLDLTIQTVASLQKNDLVTKSELFIFSDGAKSENDNDKVNQLRHYLKTISGFKRVTIFESPANKGLANSIISGATQIIEQYGKVIVLEDDLITSPNFLSFMNNALDYYQDNDKIFSIAGYTPPIKKPKHDVYFTQRASSWGWATWKNRWEHIKWNLEDEYELLQKNKIQHKAFNQMGSDMCKMLKNQMTGRINSWAIRWCYNQFLTQQYTVVPTLSKIKNIGTDDSATHTYDRFNRFYTPLDISNKVDFEFTDEIEMDPYYLNQFIKQYSIFNRIKYKILNALCR